MPFADREEAAHKLAWVLSTYANKKPLVLAIPRGAVPMARILADALGGDLDVVLVRKLGAPDNPEFAVGSVDEGGHVFLNPRLREQDLPAGYLEEEKQRQLQVMRRRRAQYTQVRPSIDPAGRVVIVVDDGVATGSTMIAALRAIRARHPARLIAATAVAPPRTLALLRKEADEVVCLEAHEDLFAIGEFFADFHQISDENVVELLRGTGEVQ